MDGSRAPERQILSDNAQLNRLTADDARIRLAWANRSHSAKVCGLFAPSSIGHYLLAGRAADETSSSVEFFDATSEYDKSFSSSVLAATAVVILDDCAFRRARYAADQVVHIRILRPDLTPLIIRVGQQPAQSELGFYLGKYPTMQLPRSDPPDEEIWRSVPLFLMEQISKARRMREPEDHDMESSHTVTHRGLPSLTPSARARL
jgi:hypothetical protein